MHEISVGAVAPISHERVWFRVIEKSSCIHIPIVSWRNVIL
jgi:hypothetical protein